MSSKRYWAIALINPEADFRRPWRPGQPLVYGDDTMITCRGSSPERAAEAAFAIANRMRADDDGKFWPPYVRSLSVGDAVYGSEEGEPGVLEPRGYYLVAPIGWRKHEGRAPEVLWATAPEHYRSTAAAH
jgi:hypothetical protein